MQQRDIVFNNEDYVGVDITGFFDHEFSDEDAITTGLATVKDAIRYTLGDYIPPEEDLKMFLKQVTHHFKGLIKNRDGSYKTLPLLRSHPNCNEEALAREKFEFLGEDRLKKLGWNEDDVPQCLKASKRDHHSNNGLPDTDRRSIKELTTPDGSKRIVFCTSLGLKPLRTLGTLYQQTLPYGSDASPGRCISPAPHLNRESLPDTALDDVLILRLQTIPSNDQASDISKIEGVEDVKIDKTTLTIRTAQNESGKKLQEDAYTTWVQKHRNQYRASVGYY